MKIMRLYLYTNTRHESHHRHCVFSLFLPHPKVFSNFFCYFFINSLHFSRFDPSPMVVGPSQHSQNAKNSAASYMRFNLYSNLHSHSRSSRNARKKNQPLHCCFVCFVLRPSPARSIRLQPFPTHSSFSREFFRSDQEKN